MKPGLQRHSKDCRLQERRCHRHGSHGHGPAGHRQQGPHDHLSWSLSSGSNLSTYGGSRTFTAHVTSTGGTSTGTFAFDGASRALAPGRASPGDATSSSGLTGGVHATQRRLCGHVQLRLRAPATTSARRSTRPAPSSFVVTTSGSPSAYGSTVTFTATVTGGGVTPTGSVQFKSDGSNIGLPVTLSGGKATLSTKLLAVGNHRSPRPTVAPNYATSTSATIHQIGNAGAVSTTVVTTSAPLRSMATRSPSRPPWRWRRHPDRNSPVQERRLEHRLAGHFQAAKPPSRQRSSPSVITRSPRSTAATPTTPSPRVPSCIRL